MPIYPYICGACGHEFDKLQKVSDQPDKHCPECGEESLRRKLTAAAFQLKGTGWYVTDFKDKEMKKNGKSDVKGDDKGDAKEKKEEKKSDTKTTDSSSNSSTSKTSSKKSQSKKVDSN